MGVGHSRYRFQEGIELERCEGYSVKLCEGRTLFQYCHYFSLYSQALQFCALTAERVRLSSRVHSRNIVTVLDYEHSRNRGMCRSEVEVVRVATEAVNHRFSQRDCFSLTEKTKLRLLGQALNGLQQLVSLHGAGFYLTENMIGVDSQNEAKVWLNENFSSPNKEFLTEKELPRQLEIHKLLSCLLDIGEKALALENCITAYRARRDELQAPHSFPLLRQFFQEVLRQCDYEDGRRVQSQSSRLSSVTELKSFSFSDKTTSISSEVEKGYRTVYK